MEYSLEYLEYSRNRGNTVPTHQALVSEGVVNAPDEEPEGPQVFKPELQHKICQQHQGPHHQELQVQERAEGGKEKGNFKSGFPTDKLVSFFFLIKIFRIKIKDNCNT